MVTPRTCPSRGSVNRDSDKVAALGPNFLRKLGALGSLQADRFSDPSRHMELIECDIDPSAYSDWKSFLLDYQAISFLSKYPGLNLGIDTAAVAFDKFSAAERSCAQTNARLTSPYVTPSIGVTPESVIHTARVKIQRLLGEFSWDECEKHFGFSGGASTRLPRRRGDAYHKFSGIPEVTLNCLRVASAAVSRIPIWASRLREERGDNPLDWFTIVKGNRLTTVPKNAKTDRIIAIEPDMNMFIQRGIGKVIRLLLKRVGVDLDSQKLNQRLALAGSVDGRLATVDLSAASDSISMELVRLLLPACWFRAISLTRSPHGVLPDGSLVEYHKVSSMGNGFTFELESLIFWAIAESVIDLTGDCERRLAIYGDDIIISVDAVPLLFETFKHVGFTPNAEKSFWSGPFRESCGKHYFHGVDVTPIYVRDAICTVSRTYWFANSIYRWASRPYDGCIADVEFFDIYNEVVNTIPVHQRFLIPEGRGDGGLIAPLSAAKPEFRNSMLRGKEIRLVMEYDSIDGASALLRSLAVLETRVGRSDGSVDGTLVPNTARCKYLTRKYTTSQWTDPPIWG